MENKALHILGEFIVEKLRIELEMQGHNNTGKLSDSITYRIVNNNLEIRALDYAKDVNFGRDKGMKPINIGALAEWVQQRGIAVGDLDIINVAYAIQAKIYQEGSPTKKAMEFSKNGRRTGFIDVTIEENMQEILNLISKAFKDDYDVKFRNIVVENRPLWEELNKN
jgi:hypothetical protein